MTQAGLFDQRAAPVSLPYQGDTVEARIAGREAADHAAVRRGRLQARYLAVLLKVGAHGLTDHEAAHALGCPVSSICSTRNGVRSQIAPHGHRRGPYGEINTVHVLRIVVGQRLDPQETEWS